MSEPRTQIGRYVELQSHKLFWQRITRATFTWFAQTVYWKKTDWLTKGDNANKFLGPYPLQRLREMIFVGDDFCTASLCYILFCFCFVLIFGPCAPSFYPIFLSWDQKSVPGMPINHIIFLIEWGCINVVEVVVVHHQCLDSANKICVFLH